MNEEREKRVRKVVANLARRHALAWALELCKEHAVELSDVIETKVQRTEVRRARRELWRTLEEKHRMSGAEVARVMCVHASSVTTAIRKREGSR